MQIARAVIDDRDAHVSGPPPGKAREPRAAPTTAGRGRRVGSRAAPAGRARARKSRVRRSDASARADDVGERPAAARQRRALQGAALEAEIERAQEHRARPPRPRPTTPAARAKPTSAAPKSQSASGRHSRWARSQSGPKTNAARQKPSLTNFGALERRRVALAGRTMHRIDRHSLMRRPLRTASSDLLPYSAPLVEGTRAACLGSIASAAPSARATPLKQDSAMWWLLAP